MSRLLWMGVGAAGGIYVYRKGQRAWEQAKVRGVSGNVTLLATTAAQWYARGLAGGEVQIMPSPSAAQPFGRAAEQNRNLATATPINRAARSDRRWMDDEALTEASGRVAELAYGTDARSAAGPSTGSGPVAGGAAAGGAAAAGVEALGNWLVRRAAAARSA